MKNTTRDDNPSGPRIVHGVELDEECILNEANRTTRSNKQRCKGRVRHRSTKRFTAKKGKRISRLRVQAKRLEQKVRRAEKAKKPLLKELKRLLKHRPTVPHLPDDADVKPPGALARAMMFVLPTSVIYLVATAAVTLGRFQMEYNDAETLTQGIIYSTPFLLLALGIEAFVLQLTDANKKLTHLINFWVLVASMSALALLMAVDASQVVDFNSDEPLVEYGPWLMMLRVIGEVACSGVLFSSWIALCQDHSQKVQIPNPKIALHEKMIASYDSKIAAYEIELDAVTTEIKVFEDELNDYLEAADVAYEETLSDRIFYINRRFGFDPPYGFDGDDLPLFN